MAIVQIITAYSYHARSRHYQARAYVLEAHFDGLPKGHTLTHSRATGLGDTREEAQADAIRYVREMMTRDGRDADAPSVIDKGRVAAVLLDNWKF